MKINNRSIEMSKRKRLVEHFYSKDEIKAVNEGIFGEEPKRIPDDVKQRAFEAIKGYNTYSKMINREGNLVDVAKTLGEIAEFASRFTVEEAGDWFDGVTIKRNMNDLKKMAGDFGKVAKEVQGHQDRMSALYEDMGVILNRYFEIADMVEEEEPQYHDNSMKVGDRATVNLNKVRKHDPTPSYVNKVKREISRGNGSVKIQEINGKKIKVSGGDVALFEVELPANSLTKYIGQKLTETVKFDAKNVEALAKKDKFLTSQLKVMSAEKVFDYYIKGNPDEEKKYNKVK